MLETIYKVLELFHWMWFYFVLPYLQVVVVLGKDKVTSEDLDSQSYPPSNSAPPERTIGIST